MENILYFILGLVVSSIIRYLEIVAFERSLMATKDNNEKEDQYADNINDNNNMRNNNSGLCN